MRASAGSLPDVHSEYPISDDQAAQYEREGHVLLRGVCSPAGLPTSGRAASCWHGGSRRSLPG
jgi:hypothetical protein